MATLPVQDRRHVQLPGSYNTWDSLAEAYMDPGDKELAILNYRKSLEVNAKNVKAVETHPEAGVRRVRRTMRSGSRQIAERRTAACLSVSE